MHVLDFRGIRKARTNVQSSNRHGEMNLAVVLVSICSVFIICHTIRLYLGLQAVFLLDTTFKCMKYKQVCQHGFDYHTILKYLSFPISKLRSIIVFGFVSSNRGLEKWYQIVMSWFICSFLVLGTWIMAAVYGIRQSSSRYDKLFFKLHHILYYINKGM